MRCAIYALSPQFRQGLDHLVSEGAHQGAEFHADGTITFPGPPTLFD